VAEQPSLLADPSAPRRRAHGAPGSGSADPATDRPVARVAADTPLPHLDHPFDYLVPASMADAAVPGARVKVRLAGRLIDAFVLERRDGSDHPGPLAPLARVVSPYPVLSGPVAELARAVADRYAGTMADVLRLAVPPRHARTEKAAAPAGADGPAGARAPADADGPVNVNAGEWRHYQAGAEFLGALAAGRCPRAVWWAPPGPSWPAMIASAVAATAASGRGALVVVPDHRDAERVAAALAATVGAGAFTTLRADAGPGERYRRYLAVRSGAARIVVGTRAAVFAPVVDLGLVVVWDDGDGAHAEPRAPYPHARDVAVLRARGRRCAVLIGGLCPSVEAAALAGVGWARPLAAQRAAVRAAAPLVEAAGSDFESVRDPAARAARLPSLAWRTARAALDAGRPVLVQVPRRGYQPSLACAECRLPARCGGCHGPLGRDASAQRPACRWCGRPVPDWRCHSCDGMRLRASVTGHRRTAEELGRAFPGVGVRTSGRDEVLASVPGTAALVVTTPGAEPVAEGGGYGAVLLLDGWVSLGRPDLRAGEETLRRWCAAAALARPGSDGGRVVVMADAALGPVQALVRWDPAGFAAWELEQRAELGFPPAVRMASVEGPAPAVAAALDAASLPAGAEVLGPVPTDPATPAGVTPASAGADAPDDREPDRERLLIRVPREQGFALAAALKAARGALGARKAPPVRIQLDPTDIA
jgi:primosomal protein N' (replication factor Y)